MPSAGSAGSNVAVTVGAVVSGGSVRPCIGTLVGNAACQFSTCACVCPSRTITSSAFGSRVSLSWLGASVQTPAPPPNRYSVIHQKSGPGFCQ